MRSLCVQGWGIHPAQAAKEPQFLGECISLGQTLGSDNLTSRQAQSTWSGAQRWSIFFPSAFLSYFYSDIIPEVTGKKR